MKYKLLDDLDKMNMSSGQGSVLCSYARLVELFGEPNSEGDEYQVSTEWGLEDEDGNVVTIHDWKSTNLYSQDCCSVSVLRSLDSYSWSVGGHTKEAADKLIEYIKATS